MRNVNRALVVTLCVVGVTVLAAQKPDPVPPVTVPPVTVRPQVPYPEPKPLVPPAPRDETEPGPRVAADYQARALLANDATFINRVSTALMVVADDVLVANGAATQAQPDKTPALTLVGVVLRDPEFAGRRMARLVAGEVPATMNAAGGNPRTSATDEQLAAYITSRWPALSMTGPQ